LQIFPIFQETIFPFVLRSLCGFGLFVFLQNHSKTVNIINKGAML